MKNLISKIISVIFLSSYLFSFSSEKDVLDTIYKWSALESDLDAQAELIRDDRVMITSKRWPNQADNLMIPEREKGCKSFTRS